MSVVACALALSLVVDISHSIDNDEYVLQMEGMARAFRSERIVSIVENNTNPIAINLITFTDEPELQIPWVIVRNREDLITLSTRIENLVRPNYFMYTNIKTSINMALDTMGDIPCETQEMVIDISADGTHNGYNDYTEAQLIERASMMGVRINALPILTYGNETQNDAVYNYLQTYTIPTGGFIIPSTGFLDFARAITQKLSMEIAMR